MRYPHFPGVGERIQKRLLALGFRKQDGSPDVGKFIRAKGWDGRYFYPYIAGRTPTGERLDRLCADLKTSQAYLLMGIEIPLKRVKKAALCLVGAIMVTATGMVPGEAGTLPLVEKVNNSDNLLRGIMTRRRKGLYSLAFLALPPGALRLSELTPDGRALWHALCEFWSDLRVGVSLIPSFNSAELRAS